MTLPYIWRLLCVCLASFFLIHTALGALVAGGSTILIRWARSMDARRAALVLFCARIAPGLLAAAAVFALCVPSYLSLEDERGSEYVGVRCLFIAACCATLLILSIGRVGRALLRSRHYLQECRSVGNTVQLTDSGSPVLVVEEPSPFLAIAGILHPALLVSRGALNALAPEQVAAALRHERAHADSHDNLKRLCLFAAPGLLPFAHGFQPIEREWSKITEWAADDSASQGDAGRSLSLAEALVRMARCGSLAQCSPLASPFVATTADVAERVDRLLGSPKSSVRPSHRPAGRLAAAGFTLASLGAITANPSTLFAVHRVLERLMH